ncbi:MAG: EscN/YscN/HrcN family type III secretion system ATPase [Candidatus Eremiobacteraeota bacterium]|nr:EscN/YscN/HrcN family type III secretion system ATPase [Candidatus Eremiobacteraeota bacterium]MBV8366341.1 EscN/YscN/HrcN family type III secretion system ATPase [Candidatus Eremiobacteraeota bacterium]
MKRSHCALPLTFEHADGLIRRGVVRSAGREVVELEGPALSPGDVAGLGAGCASYRMAAQVTRVSGDGATCVPLTDIDGLRAGDQFQCAGARLGAYAGTALLGGELDAWGRNAHGVPIPGATVVTAQPQPVPAGIRAPVRSAMRSGIAAIDTFVPIGYGQRVSVASGGGVGKTTLLRELLERADVDARVVALVGERGREVEETSRRLRSSPCWRSTSLFCTPAEARPLERFAAARSATAQAEWLCRTGRRVLLVVDSITRVAQAWREHALAAGEAPAARGHPPSLVRALATLLERAGARVHGSLTAVYAVLVEGDDPNEPVADALRAMLDGHIVLSRALADAGRRPAIDVLRSLSRAMPDIVDADHASDASIVRRALATLEEAADLIAVGAYRAGNDAWLDACIGARDEIDALIFDGGACSPEPRLRLSLIAHRLRKAAA